MVQSKIRIYLSACISNAPNNVFICSKFPSNKFIFDLPQEITPKELNHENFPLEVFQQCITMMEASDIGLLLLDSYGRDCAWEIGWFCGQARPTFAYVETESQWLGDSMVKGGVTAIITNNPAIYDLLLKDPATKTKSYLIPSKKDLGALIKKIYYEK